MGGAEGAAPTGAEPPVAEATRGRRGRWPSIARLLCSLCLLAWVVSRADLGAVLSTLASSDARWVLALNLLFPLAPLVSAMRWQGLLRSQGHPLPLRLLLGSCMVAIFFRQFLPSTLGGDVIRLWDTWRAGVPRTHGLVALMVDRLVGLLVLVVFALGALWAVGASVPSRGPVAVAALVMGAAVALVVVALFRPRRRGPALAGSRWERVLRWPPVARALEAMAAFRGAKAGLLRALALSALLQAVVITFYWLIGRALALGVSWVQFAALVPVAVLVMTLPVSINGIGLREGVFVLLLGAVGIDPSRALAFAWAEYALLLAWGLLGGVLYGLRPRALTTPEAPAGPALRPAR